MPYHYYNIAEIIRERELSKPGKWSRIFRSVQVNTTARIAVTPDKPGHFKEFRPDPVTKALPIIFGIGFWCLLLWSELWHLNTGLLILANVFFAVIIALYTRHTFFTNQDHLKLRIDPECIHFNRTTYRWELIEATLIMQERKSKTIQKHLIIVLKNTEQYQKIDISGYVIPSMLGFGAILSGYIEYYKPQSLENNAGFMYNV